MGKKQTHEELEQRFKALKMERVGNKRFGEARKESESRFRDLLKANVHKFPSLFNFYPQPIALTELETGRVIDVNDMFCDVSQFTREEVVGRTSVELGSWSVEERNSFLEGLKKSGEIHAAEESTRVKDGSLRRALRFSKIVELGGENLIISIFVDITERKRAEEALRRSEKELAKRNLELEEINAALRVLLSKREEDKAELEKTVLFNVKNQIVPYLEKLKQNGLNGKNKECVDMIEANLKNVASSSFWKLSPEFSSLTPSELRVAHLIREGHSSKAIAELMNVSFRTVECHRNNIRRKLGLKHKKSNLRTHLLSIR